jgi:hypothetical protein
VPNHGEAGVAEGDIILVRAELLKAHLPALAMLTATLLFWVYGAAGGLKFLYPAHTPLASLLGLYAMLFLLCASVGAAAVALHSLLRGDPTEWHPRPRPVGSPSRRLRPSPFNRPDQGRAEFSRTHANNHHGFSLPVSRGPKW